MTLLPFDQFPVQSGKIDYLFLTHAHIDHIGKEVHRLEGLIEFHESFSLKQGITFNLSNAGHILGSCFIRFEIPNDTSKTQNSKPKTWVYDATHEH